MPARPRWLLAIPDAIRQLDALDREFLTRRDIERLFGVSKVRAAQLMATFGAGRTGHLLTLPRAALLRQLRRHRKRAAFRGEEARRERVVTAIRKARLTGIRVAVPVEALEARLSGLPAGVSVEPGRIEVRFSGAKDAVGRLFALAQALTNDYERFEALVEGGRRRARRGRGEGMSDDVVRVEPPDIAHTELAPRAALVLPRLIETSPVGVVVFEARTGALVSLNREAARIVKSLCGPGQSAEQLLGVITCRRADGREIALDRLPLARALDRAETVRAEEVVLSVPDGRSVTTLINATPIRDPDGPDDALASVVVTLQDLAPLQEIERMRAEFLGMVSHELRAPLTSIKGSAATALRASRLVGPAEVAQFFRIIDEQADRMDSLIGDLLDAGRIDTGTLSVAPEPSDVAVLVDQARGTFISGGGRHTVRIDLPPDLPRVMADRQRLVQVLNNLLANAARHAPDSAPIRIAAEREGLSVAVSVADEGRGIAPDQLGQLFRKYTTAGDRKGGLGSGLGLAICKGLVEAQGGRIRAESGGVGLGARFTFTIPVAEAASDRPAPARPAPARRATPRTRCPSSWSTTTRRRCAISATRWRRRATPRWSPATPGSWRASSGPKSPNWSCST